MENESTIEINVRVKVAASEIIVRQSSFFKFFCEGKKLRLFNTKLFVKIFAEVFNDY